MNILLMNSYVESEDNKMIMSGRCQIRRIPGIGIWPPIDLAQIASMIREYADHISIIDFMVSTFSRKEAYSRILAFNPDIIIVQTSTPTLKNDILFYRHLKYLIPKIKIIFFGLHATIRPEDIVSPDIEFTVRNEPEMSLLELIKSLKENHNNFQNIRGLSYWKDSRVVHNLDREFVENLDSLSFPARDLLRNEQYILPYNKKPFSIIQVSRGCPYPCIFCTASLYYGRKWRCRSPQNIVAEIKEVVNKYKIKNFLFLSDIFNFEENFVFKLCSLIIHEKLNIKWVCNSRVDKFNLQMAKQMRRAGCWLISLGIESASNSILKNVKKNITLTQAKETIAIARKAGIKTLSYFIFGLPGENKDTVEETFSFIKRNKIDYAHFYTATPFPGTEFYNLAKNNGWLISEDWNRYFHGSSDVISYPSFSNRNIQDAVTKAYSTFYLRPHIILREISAISSLKQFVGFIEIGREIVKLIFSKDTHTQILDDFRKLDCQR